MSTTQSQAQLEPPKEAPKNASLSVFSVLPGALRRLEVIERQNPARLALFTKIYQGRATRNQCIKGQCLDCMGFDSAAVRDCADRLCPLWCFRPFQRKQKQEEKNDPE